MTDRIKKHLRSSIIGIGNTNLLAHSSLKSGFITANRYKYFLHLTSALALNSFETI